MSGLKDFRSKFMCVELEYDQEVVNELYEIIKLKLQKFVGYKNNKDTRDEIKNMMICIYDEWLRNLKD